MSNRLEQLRQDFVGTAVGVTILVLLVVSGLLTLSGGIFIIYDLIASHSSWGEKLAYLVNLPKQDLLSIVVTAIPTLVQVAYISAKIAGLEFASSKSFNRLYWISLSIDTALDTYQMQQGTMSSIGASLFVAIVLFGALSEFLFIFSGSIFIGLLYRLLNEDGLLESTFEDTRQRTTGRRTQQNRRQRRDE